MEGYILVCLGFFMKGVYYLLDFGFFFFNAELV